MAEQAAQRRDLLALYEALAGVTIDRSSVQTGGSLFEGNLWTRELSEEEFQRTLAEARIEKAKLDVQREEVLMMKHSGETPDIHSVYEYDNDGAGGSDLEVIE